MIIILKSLNFDDFFSIIWSRDDKVWPCVINWSNVSEESILQTQDAVISGVGVDLREVPSSHGWFTSEFIWLKSKLKGKN